MAAAPEREESLAAMVREVADDAVRLARAEIELAKAEAIAGIKRVALAIGLFAGAAVFALFMIGFALGAVPTLLAGRGSGALGPAYSLSHSSIPSEMTMGDVWALTRNSIAPSLRPRSTSSFSP